MFNNRWLSVCSILFLTSLCLRGQEAGGLRVVVTDPSGAAVPDALVAVSDEFGSRRAIATEGDASSYVANGLDPGLYRLEVSKAGFDTYVIEKLHIHSRDSQVIRVSLRVTAAAKQTVTVTAEMEGISADPSTGTAVDGKYLADLPVNSRSFTSLLTLAPGLSDAGDGPDGGIHANGLRSNTNYYMVDGVSANTGTGPGGGAPAGPGGFGGGAAGANGTGVATNASGNSSNLISLDSIKEMQVQTSSFAPEFGRSPGAQISITSRGGTNEYHGSAFYYLRNSRFNANDWFNNENRLGRGFQELNDLGLTTGGPVQKNKTFFFLSFEGSHLEQPHTEVDTVPDNQVRARIKGTLSPYLNAFPLANGPEVGIDVAEFNTTYSTPSTSSSESLRIDRIISPSMTAFLRYSRSPSTASSRGGLNSTANSVMKRNGDTQSLTGSTTWIDKDEQIHNLRVNLSRTLSRSSSSMDTYGGAKLLSDSLLFPSGINSTDGSYSLNVSGVGGYSVGNKSDTSQNQFNVIYDESGVAGKINAKIGIDYRVLLPTYRVLPYTAFVSFNGISDNTDALLSGTAQTASVTSNVTGRYPFYQNMGFYYQHAYKSSPYTTLTYGFRWDVNPAPSARSGAHLLGLDSSDNLSSSSPLYHTRWFNFAPRFGTATELSHSPGHELVFRGGVGIFYDTAYGATASAFNNPPYSNTITTTEPNFPLTSSVTQAPVLPPTTPYGVISGADPSLKSPVIYEFNATFEKHLGAGRVLSAGFLGSHGGGLLTTQTQPGFFSTTYSMLQLTSNGGNSDYRALQTQFRQTVGRFLMTQASYTFGHSVDTSSNDSGVGGFAIVQGKSTADSNYDMRHSMTATASLAIPSPEGALRFLRPALGNWYVDMVASAHSSLPFDVEGQAVQSGASCPSSGTSSISLCQKGFAALVRPNLTGAPIWIVDPNVPGGRRLNPAAFSIPTSGEGNEGRNAIRGFNFSNVDLSLRRKISLTEKISLQLRADAYNLLNHANFANPSALEGANLSDANFGIATRMLYNSFGGGSVQSSGAPRSVQLSMRVQF
jgi:hypothetical protein